MSLSRAPLSAANILNAIVDDSTRFSGANIDAAISTATIKQMLFLGDITALTNVTTVAAAKTMSSIVLPNLSLTVDYAQAGIKIGGIRNDAGANNRLDSGNLEVDVGSAGWLAASSDVGSWLFIGNEDYAPSPSFEFWGHIDVTGKVAFNTTVQFQFDNVSSLANTLYLYNIQPMLLIICH